MLAGEVVDEFSPVGVVLADVVVVDRLLNQLVASHEPVDSSGCGVGAAEERFAVDLADDLPLALDGRVGADHLQIEYKSAGLDRIDHVAQDVHDVLRFHSSE